MKHALVVGGTGMLAGLSLWLLNNGYHVSVNARNAGPMNKLIAKANSKSQVTPLFVDYKNTKELQGKVNATIKENGKVDIVVAWIHSYADEALSILANEVAKHTDEWELFHVLGSSSDLSKIRRGVSVPDNCLYYQVQLGFVVEGAHSRWLTNKEISNGVIDAIKKKEKIRIVGQLEPWDMRP